MSPPRIRRHPLDRLELNDIVIPGAIASLVEATDIIDGLEGLTSWEVTASLEGISPVHADEASVRLVRAGRVLTGDGIVSESVSSRGGRTTTSLHIMINGALTPE